MRRGLPVLAILLVCGCSFPRLFQSKVPAPVVKAQPQLEAERQAADLIAKKIETPVELKPVATKLSESLGAPEKSLADAPNFRIDVASARAVADLQTGILQLQEQLRQTNLRLVKLQGKEIEGTGFSVLGPGTATIVIGLIILGVVFPPAFTLMGIAYRRIKQTASMVVDQIDEASKDPETQAAMKKVKSKLGDMMDTDHKRVIHALQKP